MSVKTDEEFTQEVNFDDSNETDVPKSDIGWSVSDEEKNMDTTKNKQEKGKKKKRSESSQRLREIISVLKSREILKGVTPEKIRLILEDLGPTFVKLGQIMSMRPDLLSFEYCDELTKLRSDVKPMPFSDVVDVIEQEYSVKYTTVFSNFCKKPIGSASIAQVHKATLKENGEEVVVKVQRKHIKQVMSRDITMIKRAIKLLNIVVSETNPIDFNMLVDEMWAVAQEEMDFWLEAQNLQEFAKLNKDIEYVTCPKVYPTHTTSKVLVMEFINGIPIDQNDKLTELGYDMDEIGRKLAENYAKQFLDDAFFHADPHPGNIWIRDGKIVWLDFGMVGRLSPHDRKLFSDAVIAIAQNDVYELKNVILSLGTVSGRINHTRLYTDIDDFLIKFINSDIASINMGDLMEELMDIARAHKISMPPGISMLARGGVTIEGVLEKCSPSISYVEMVRNHVSADFINDLDINSISREFVRDLFSGLTKGAKIPSQMSDLLKMTSKGQTKINLDITGMDEPLKEVHEMVNKLIICIISAALLVGSSIVSVTQMDPKIMGIPALGFFGFFIAFILSVWLIVSVSKKKKKR